MPDVQGVPEPGRTRKVGTAAAKNAAPPAVTELQVRDRLVDWYRRGARDLPWRRSKDPYAVWVSEVMLQQTRVDVATPYYLRWMERFPTVQALGEADLEDVLRSWAGLGYYSRARNLHAAAQLMAARGGTLPGSAAGLRELPGIGDYTAGAIASIAFGERVPAVDGNVVRVLARLHAWPGSASSPALKGKVRRAAARLVPGDAPGDWNQALMDLGATICTPRDPHCDACPVAKQCQAEAKGIQERIPAPKRMAPPKVERRAFAVVRRQGCVLLVRNPPRGLLAGLWSLPGGLTERPLADLVLEQAGVAVRLGPAAAPARHQFSHRTWEMAVHHAIPLSEAGVPAAETAWVAIEDLRGHALPAAMHCALAAAGVGTPVRYGRKPKRRQGSGPS
ncbi:MAG TPA: A/G-specific adenine glycosylase [Candidatus Thermoplasmatota archaeon]|nr:A/G-specific adenine glycosylase [Candidatus Thermoplasmatota archaeon]